MPVVHKSTIKRARQSEKRRQRNRANMRGSKSVVKKIKQSIEQKNLESAQSLLREATSALHKASTKGILKRNTVSRRISRLAIQVNKLKAS